MKSAKDRLLIVWHSRTGTSKAMAQAAAEGAGDLACLVSAPDIQPGHLHAAAAYVFVCPENLASMSGEMKEMFDRTYYPVLGQIEGRAFATAIAAGSDGESAQRQIDRIAKGWRLRRVAEPLIVITHAQTPDAILAPKTLTAEQRGKCYDLGCAVAEGLRLGMF